MLVNSAHHAIIRKAKLVMHLGWSYMNQECWINQLHITCAGNLLLTTAKGAAGKRNNKSEMTNFGNFAQWISKILHGARPTYV